MHGIDGFDLYAKIKDMDPDGKIYYFLTASELYLEEYRKEDYKKLSPDLFMIKPIAQKN
jgi:hypothetical protein